jgi:hypothetical protein
MDDDHNKKKHTGCTVSLGAFALFMGALATFLAPLL